eukprot:scaffold17971_cov101-Isochrysis_galbana.AAC.2
MSALTQLPFGDVELALRPAVLGDPRAVLLLLDVSHFHAVDPGTIFEAQHGGRRAELRVVRLIRRAPRARRAAAGRAVVALEGRAELLTERLVRVRTLGPHRRRHHCSCDHGRGHSRRGARPVGRRPSAVCARAAAAIVTARRVVAAPVVTLGVRGVTDQSRQQSCTQGGSQHGRAVVHGGHLLFQVEHTELCSCSIWGALPPKVVAVMPVLGDLSNAAMPVPGNLSTALRELSPSSSEADRLSVCQRIREVARQCTTKGTGSSDRSWTEPARLAVLKLSHEDASHAVRVAAQDARIALEACVRDEPAWGSPAGAAASWSRACVVPAAAIAPGSPSQDGRAMSMDAHPVFSAAIDAPMVDAASAAAVTAAYPLSLVDVPAPAAATAAIAATLYTPAPGASACLGAQFGDVAGGSHPPGYAFGGGESGVGGGGAGGSVGGSVGRTEHARQPSQKRNSPGEGVVSASSGAAGTDGVEGGNGEGENGYGRNSEGGIGGGGNGGGGGDGQ